MYVYYYRQPGARRILHTFGVKFAPVVFMTCHILFFVVSSFFAIIAYHYFFVHTLMMIMWILVSIWNGANFYMEYFARKYETNLKRLE